MIMRLTLSLLIAFLILTLVLAFRVDGAEPHAMAVEFESRTIYHAPEKPGYAAWVELWRQGDRLVIKFLKRRKPAAGQILSRLPLDVRPGPLRPAIPPLDFADGGV